MWLGKPSEASASWGFLAKKQENGVNEKTTKTTPTFLLFFNNVLNSQILQILYVV